jgi:hypothetical protein
MTPRAKTGGRTRNTPNKINAKAREMVIKIIASEIEKLPDMLEELKPVDRANLLIKMLQYILPKQSKIELEAEVNGRFTPVIVQVIEEPLKIEE